MLPGLDKRLHAELVRLHATQARTSVKISASEDREFAVWKGASILAGLPSFRDQWIGSDEYSEYGVNIVHQKCF